ncbi:MAG: DUF3109 family protein, partial [Ignavibacteriae bacterium]|nr:DUF3109 family protein [Ignavibacteriota bacterium]
MIHNNTKYFFDDRIFSTNFVCDISLCKGGCCTIRSQYGAPLKEEEIEIIKCILEKIEKYISIRNLNVIKKRDFYFRDGEKIYLNNVNDEDCVFSYITEGIAKCAFEKAYEFGEIDFKKPISCELFPIRVYGDEKNVLRFEKMNECEDAVINGNEKKIRVVEFVKDALERAFGKEF